LSGIECSCLRDRGAGHAYLESGSAQQGWLVTQVLPGQFGSAACPVSHSDVKLMWWVTLEISLFLGGWPLLFSLEWWGLYMVRGVWLPSRLPLEGVSHICTYGS
jgi:hypothetical protein